MNKTNPALREFTDCLARQTIGKGTLECVAVGCAREGGQDTGVSSDVVWMDEMSPQRK